MGKSNLNDLYKKIEEDKNKSVMERIDDDFNNLMGKQEGMSIDEIQSLLKGPRKYTEEEQEKVNSMSDSLLKAYGKKKSYPKPETIADYAKYLEEIRNSPQTIEDWEKILQQRRKVKAANIFNELNEGNIAAKNALNNFLEPIVSTPVYLAGKLGAGAINFSEDLIDGAGQFTSWGLSKATFGGVSDWFEEQSEMFANRKNLGAMFSERLDENFNVPSGVRFGGNVFEAAGGLAIPIAAEIFTGTASPALELSAPNYVSKFAKAFNQIKKPSSIMFGMSAAGGYAESAYKKTGNLDQSVAYGAMMGAMELVSESLFAGYGGTGIGKKTGSGKLPKFMQTIGSSKAADVVKAFGNTKAVKYTLDVMEEGAEEVIVTGVDPIIQRITGVGSNAEFATGEEYRDSAVMGMALSMFMKASVYPITNYERKENIAALNAVAERANLMIENEADKISLLESGASIEEITKKQGEIRAFTTAFADEFDRNVVPVIENAKKTGNDEFLNKTISDSIAKDASLPNIVKTIAAIEGRSADYYTSQEAIDTARAVLNMANDSATRTDYALIERSEGARAVVLASQGTGAWESMKAEADRRVRSGASQVRNTEYGVQSDATSSTASGVKYKIAHTTENKPVVVIENDILQGISKKKWADTAKKAIEKLKPGIKVSGRFVKVNAQTTGEYLHSDYTDSLKKNEKIIYKDKLNASGHLDEIVLSSRNYINEDLKHERTDNIKEFARGEVLMQIGKNQYNASVIIGLTKGDSMVLYDIVDITPSDFDIKKASDSERTSDNPSQLRTESLAKTNPSYSGSKTNQKYSDHEGLVKDSISKDKGTVNSKDMHDGEIYSNGERVKFPGRNNPSVSDADTSLYTREASSGGYIIQDEVSREFRRKNEKGYRNVQKMAKDLKMRVMFVNGLTDSDGNVLDGAITSEGIIINAEAENPSRFVATHEFSHLLRERAPKEWNKYQRYVIYRLKKTGQYKERYEAKQGVYDKKQIDEELACDYIGEMFSDEAELAEFIKADRSFAVRIRDFWYDILEKLGLKKEKVDAKSLWMKAYNAAMKSEKSVKGEKSKIIAMPDGSGRRYDYSKPFAQQLKDFISGKIPENDTLIVGETPEVFKKIGFNALPVTIAQGHVRAALNKNSDADHYLGEAGLKQLPEALEKPVAVIRSASHSDRVVALLPIRLNGKTVIAPFEIDGNGRNNNIQIDANAITSVYGKNSILKQLVNALSGEANGKTEVFYWNKKEALSLLQGKGLQLPSSLPQDLSLLQMPGLQLPSDLPQDLSLLQSKGLQLPSSLPQDGFVHSIRENGANINTKFENVTETQQFKRWFGKSKVVNSDGTPLIMYHGTSTANGEFFAFDSSQAKKRVGLGLKQLGKGNYFTRSDLSSSERYDRILPVYLSIKKPFVVENDFMKEIKSKLGIDTNNYDEIQSLMRAKGYDGVIKNTSTGNIGIAVTFDSEQIKSATDNIGTFDRSNPDIRYSHAGTRVSESSQVASLQAENEQLRAELENIHIQLEQAEGRGLDTKAIKDAAEDIKRAYGSKIKTAVLHQELTTKAISGITSATMAMNAASNQMISIADRGGNDAQIMLGGVAAGFAEYFFEKFSVENLLSSSNKGFIKTLLKQSGIEASEEFATEIANILSDTVIMGERSESRIRTRELISKEGMTAEEATRKVFFENLDSVLQAAASGAVSGAVMSGGKTAFGGMRNGATQVRSTEYGVRNEKIVAEIAKDASLPNIVKTIAAIEGRSADYYTSQEAIDTARAVLNMANDSATRTDYALIERSEGARAVVLASQGTGAWESMKKAAQKDSDTRVDMKATKSGIGMKKSVREYPYDMKKVITDYINSTNKTLLEKVKKFRTDKNAKFERVNLGNVTDKESTDIKRLTGDDVSGYIHAINSNAFNHIEKRHGENGQHDSTMANPEDVARVEYVLENYDSVELATKENGDMVYSNEFKNSDNEHSPLLVYTKKINGTYYAVVASAENAYKKLWVVTTYMSKNKEGITQELHDELSSLSLTSETKLASLPSTNSISEDKGTVNSKDMHDGENQSQEEGIGVKYSVRNTRYSDIDIDSGEGKRYNSSSEQFRTMWTLEDEVLSKREIASFYTKISEMAKQGYSNYHISNEGEYIFEVGNKLIYTDGDYDYPEITRVVTFNTNDENLINYGRRCVYESIEYGYQLGEALEISETLLGQGNAFARNFEDSGAFERKIGKGKRFNNTEFDSGSGENVNSPKYSVKGVRSGATQVRNAEYGVRSDNPSGSSSLDVQSGVKYKIAQNSKGKYVKASRQVIKGNNPKEWAGQVEAYINDSIRKNKDVMFAGADGDLFVITTDTAGKARFRNVIDENGKKRRMTDSEYATKLRAETHIDELIQTSKIGKSRDDSKSHSFAKDGFNYRKAYFEDFDGTYYEVTISVGKNGIVNTVYNVGRLDKRTNPSYSGSKTNQKYSDHEGLVKDSISKDKGTVNSKDMHDGEIYSNGEKVTIDKSEKTAGNIVLDKESRAFYKKDAKGYKAIAMMAKDLGMKVKFVKGLVDGEGNVLDGVITSEGIFINTESENPTRWAATHEFSHRMKQTGGKTWQVYQDYVIAKMKKDGTYETRYNAKKGVYAAEVIDEEIAADYIGELFSDVNELADFIKHNRSGAVKVRDLWYKILDKFGLLDEKIKARAMWAEAYKEAMKNSGVKYEDGAKFKVEETVNFSGEESDKASLIRIIEENFADIQSNANVFDVSSKEIESNKVASEGIYEYFKSIGGIALNPQIGIVELNKKGAKTTTFHGMGKEKYNATIAIKPVIEKGKIVHFEKNWKNRGYDTYVIVGKGIIDAKDTIIGVIIKSYPKSNLNNKFYLHEAIKIGVNSDTAVENNATRVDESTPTNNTVPQNTPVVKNNSMQESSKNAGMKSVSGTRVSDVDTIDEQATPHQSAELTASPQGEALKAKFTDRFDREKLKKRIDSDYSYLYSMVKEPTDKRHIPEQLRPEVAAVLDCIDFETVQLDRIRDAGKEAQSPKAIRLTQIKGLYESIIRKAWGVEKGSGSKLFDEYLSEDLRELKESIPADESGNFKRLQDMSTEELRVISDVLRGIHHAVTKSNQAFTEGIKESISEAGDNTVAEMTAVREKRRGSGEKLDYNERGLSRVSGALDKLLNVNMLQPWDLFHKIGGTLEKIYGENRKAFDRHIVNLKSASEEIKKAVGKLNIRKMTGKKATVEKFRLENGSSVEIDKGQLLSLYALYKRPQGKEHLLSGGIVTGRKATDQNGNKISGNTIHKVTEADLGEMFETLSKEEKQMVEDIVRFMSKECAQWGNEASMKLYGYEKYGEGWYFPIKVADTTLEAWSGGEHEGNLRTQSFTKKLVRNTENAVVIGDFFDTVTGHINGMSLYNTIALPMLDMERVLNYKAYGETVRQSIDITYGKAVNRYISKWLEDVNGGRKVNSDGGISEKLFKNVKKASIGMNMRVLLQQPTSIMRVLQFMSPTDLTAATKAFRHPIETIKEMQENVPIAYWKSLGFRDVGVGSSLKDAITDNESLYDKLAMGGYGAMDDVTWALIYTAVKHEVQRKNPDIDINSAQFRDMVTERFNYIVDRSQVVDSVFHRSQIMRSERDMVRIATMFMSEPIKQFNMYKTEIEDAIKSGSGKSAAKQMSRATAVYMFSNLILALVQALPDAWREDDEKDLYDENGKEILFGNIYLKKVGDDFVDDINPLNSVPYVKDIISAINGYSLERVEYSSLVKTINAIKGLDNSRVPLPTRIYNVFKSGAELFGCAPGNLVRDFEGIIRSTMRGVGDEYTDYVLTKTKWDVNNPDNQSKFMKHYERALKNGHAEDAAKIFSDYSGAENSADLKAWCEESARLYTATGKQEHFYSVPVDSFNFNGQETELSEKQYAEYKAETDRKYIQLAAELIRSDYYKSLPDYVKVKKLDALKSYITTSEKMKYYPVDLLDNKKSTAVMSEMDRLFTSTGQAVMSGMPQDNFSVDKKTVELSDGEYRSYVDDAYETLWNMAYDFVKSEEYGKLSDEEKVDGLRDLREYSQNAEKGKYSDDYELKGWQKKVYDGDTEFIDSFTERLEDAKYQDKREEYKDTFTYDASEYTPEEAAYMENIEADAASYYSAIEMGREYNEQDLRYIQVYDDYLSGEMEIEEFAGIRAYAKKTAAMADGNPAMKKSELEDYLDSTDYSQAMKAALFEAIGNKGWKNKYSGGKVGDGRY